jgi:hypothetical protein
LVPAKPIAGLGGLRWRQGRLPLLPTLFSRLANRLAKAQPASLICSTKLGPSLLGTRENAATKHEKTYSCSCLYDICRWRGSGGSALLNQRYSSSSRSSLQQTLPPQPESCSQLLLHYTGATPAFISAGSWERSSGTGASATTSCFSQH